MKMNSRTASKSITKKAQLLLILFNAVCLKRTNAFIDPLQPLQNLHDPSYYGGNGKFSSSNPLLMSPRLIDFHSGKTLIQLNFAKTDENSAGKNEASENQELLQKAVQLRKEAQELESALEQSRTKLKKSNDNMTNIAPLAKYTTLKDSCWALTYRFSKDPISNENDKKDGSSNNLKPFYYSGKIGLCFREDGFTDKISLSNENENDPTIQNIKFEKIWGWDEEVSNEDELTYLLFSADITLQVKEAGDDLKPKVTQERFYFQARIDSDRQGIIELADGTVTVKREVERTNTGGKLFWGIFDGSGILAQFRNVGNFSCKPIRRT